MKLFKFSLLSFFVFFSLLVATPIFAAVTPPAETPVATTPQAKIDPFVIADISIQNAKIVSQDGNKINLSFDVVNGAGAQAGLKYSVSLVKDITNISKFADEYISPDTLSLSTNTTTKKEVTYTAPAYLSGDYSLVIQIKNDSNLLYGISNVGKVKLVATSEMASTLNITEKACSLSIVGEKGSPKYSIYQNIDISSDEQLMLNCEVVNSSKKEITAVPTYEVHNGAINGEILSVDGVDATPVTLKAGEKKTISFTLPKTIAPRNYSVKFSLKSGEVSSSPIVYTYIVRGLSVSLGSFSLDKDYYTKGDTANLSIIWDYSFSNANSRIVRIKNSKDTSSQADLNQKAPVKPVTNLVVSIVDENQNECINPINQVLDYDSNGILKIPAKITKDCKNPQAQIQIKDADGNILVGKQFSFITNTESAQFLKANTFFNKYGMFIIILGILVVAGISFYFINLKKKEHANHDLSKTNEPTIQ